MQAGAGKHVRKIPCHIQCDVRASALARCKRAFRSGTRAILSIDQWFELLDDEPHVFVRGALDPGRLISRRSIIARASGRGVNINPDGDHFSHDSLAYQSRPNVAFRIDDGTSYPSRKYFPLRSPVVNVDDGITAAGMLGIPAWEHHAIPAVRIENLRSDRRRIIRVIIPAMGTHTGRGHVVEQMSVM